MNTTAGGSNAGGGEGMHALPELQSFESPSTCADSVMVKVEGKLYLVAGFDDGVVCLLEMNRLNGQSFVRVVYQKSHNDDE